MTDKASLLDLSRLELKELITGWAEPAYRAEQIETWLYKRYITDVAEMNNLPKALRQHLSDECLVDPLRLVILLDSSDGYTRKALFALPDGQEVEAVLAARGPRVHFLAHRGDVHAVHASLAGSWLGLVPVRCHLGTGIGGDCAQVVLRRTIQSPHDIRLSGDGMALCRWRGSSGHAPAGRRVGVAHSRRTGVHPRDTVLSEA